MKKVFLTFFATLTFALAFSQRYYTKAANITFDASSSAIDVIGTSNVGVSVIDSKSGAIEIAVPITSFIFKRQLMQEHFNENYMESPKFPKAFFKGTITNISEVNFTKDGNYNLKMTGTMEMHGVKKEMTVSGLIKVFGGQVTGTSQFNVELQDHNITIPGLVIDAISPTAKVSITAIYQMLK
jgi:uncharacterized membrane protein